VPRSTSKTESPRRRRTQPLPPPPDSAGLEIPIPDVAGGARFHGNHDVGATQASPGGPQGHNVSDPTGRPAPPKSRRPARTPRGQTRLSETIGPDPNVPPDRVRLTIGEILAPHGVRGEFKLRLQTDDPEHLLTLKRAYLGEETIPRTVLGVRLHAGNALMRLQGISTPETVERFRGTPIRIRGADARPLAANEYFLYQVIGLEVFDEAGNRLGRVTDVIETGANDVLVVTAEDGTDTLLPSHPDVVLAMDPAAGRIVVRPLTYYGE
jgi:16S rRNA processing protein RimM